MALTEFDSSSGEALRDAPPAHDSGLTTLPLDALVPSPFNRKIFDPVKLQELADSVSTTGVIQPILVRVLPADRLADSAHAMLAGQELLADWKHRAKKTPRPGYEIVYGERRWRASLLAQQQGIPAIVRPLTDAQVLEIQLTENLQRDDLHPLDEAEGYQRLCDMTGMKKEELGTKLGKSRSYVYQRLGLLKLGQEARQAFRDGKLDFSRALLLAGVADPKLQIKALKEVTDERYGHPMSVRDFRHWLEQNVFLQIQNAPFDTKDTTLVDGAGTCADCPKRTGVDRDIFAEYDSPDLCTDAKCYGKKASVSLERIKEAAASKGMQVIAGVEAKKLRPQTWNDEIKGYTRVDEKVEGGKTLASALGKDAPAPTLFVDPHTHKQVKVLPNAVVGELLKQKGLELANAAQRSHAGDQEKFKAQRRKDEIERRIIETTRLRAASEILAKVRGGAITSFSADFLRQALARLLRAMQDAYYDDGLFDHVAKLWGLPVVDEHDDPFAPIERHVNAAPDEEIGPMFMGYLLASEIHYTNYGDGKQAVVIPLLGAEAGVDVDAIAKEVKAEIRAEVKAEEVEKRAKAKAPRAKSGAAQAEGEPEGTAAAKGKGRGKKLSAADAKQGIAEAMQQSDDQPDEE